MKEEKYTIGEFSKLTGISKDTLRFYDKIGLLQPKMVGESSRYRYYTFDQFWYADMAICLQRLNVPLQQITEVFAGKQDREIIQLLKEHREDALRMSEYFMRAADDIEWYSRQDRILEESMTGAAEPGIHVEYFTQRDVMYVEAENEDVLPRPENVLICHEKLKLTDSIKRVRGYVLKKEALCQNELLVEAAYIDIGMSELGDMPEHVMTLPDGEYACMVCEVIDGLIDLSDMNRWLQEHDRQAELVIADDLGLQFFVGKPDAYLCEVKVLIRKKVS